MHILCAFDEKYVPLAKVLFTSLMRNHTERIVVHILESELSEKSKRRLIKKYTKHNFILTFHHVLEDRKQQFENLQHDGRMTPESYYRFLLLDPEIIEESVERILWLDVDTVVDKSIIEFYQSDFEDALFIACEDRSGKGDSVWEHFHTQMKAPLHQTYYNAGVLLCNLKKLRENYSVEDIIDYAIEHKEILLLGDQDILNGMFGTKIKGASPLSYNCMIRHMDYFNQDTIHQIEKKAHILHFTNDVKPYERFYKQETETYFWKYAKFVDSYRYEYIRRKIRGMYRTIKAWIKK